MANLNLNSNVQKIIVKPDQTQLIITGGTGNVINSNTAIGDNIPIFDGNTGKYIKDSGKNLSEFASSTGLTNHTQDTSIHYVQSAITITESQVTNLVDDLANKSNTGHTHSQYSPTGHTHSQYGLQADLASHTGNTSIHFAQSAITITESQVTGLIDDLANKSNTGHTHSQYALALTNDENYVSDAELQVLQNTSGTNSGDQVGDGVTILGTGTIADPFVAVGGGGTGGTPTVISVNGKQGIITLFTDDITVTGTTNQYASASEKADWNSKQPAGNYASSTGLTNHTQDTDIHFVMSAITITESQVTGLVNDLQDRSLTGHTHTEYSPTGHTHSQYALGVDLNSHTGDTSIHFAQSAITITESQVTGLVNDLASKSNTGHTHTQYATFAGAAGGADSFIMASRSNAAGDKEIIETTATNSDIVNAVYDINNTLLPHVSDSVIHTPVGAIQLNSEKDQAGGYSSLDAGGKIPLANLPSTLLIYKGVWNAFTNTPTLTTPDATKAGWVYNVGTSGVTFGITWKLGDWLIYNDQGVIEKSDNSDDVVSVNGKQGVVVLNADDIATGSTNYFLSSTQKALLNGLAGTLTATELNYVDGVTSSIQTQLGNRVLTNRAVWVITGNTTLISTYNNSIVLASGNITLTLANAQSTGNNLYIINVGIGNTITIITQSGSGSVLHGKSTLTYTNESVHVAHVGANVWEVMDYGADKLQLSSITNSKGLTGFIGGDSIAVSYNYTNRTITLTGTLDYQWRGVKYTLTSPFTSAAHTATVGSWYLYINAANGTPVWSQSPWTFDQVMIAYVNYQATAVNSFAIKETHGIMDYLSHQEFHNQIGTYLASGGKPTAGTYLENTATDAATTPSFDAATVKDEDLITSVNAWTEGTYTIMYVSGTTSLFNTTSPFPFVSTGGYIPVNNPSTGGLPAGVANRYYNVYQIIMPSASDVDSQKYRMIMVQPQATFTSLALAQAEDVRALNLGSLSSLSPEFVIYTRITYNTNASNNNNGKVTIPTGGISYITGNKSSQLSVTGLANNNHNALANLNWTDSGHIGTNNTLASFNSTGLAESLPKNTFSLQTDLVSHSGNTYIHFEQSGITITESQVTNLVSDLAGKISASSTDTLTNKRITKRVGTTTSSATPTINTDNVDIYSLTAQAEAITSFTTNLTGTPTDGQLLWIQITGTAARAITWGTSFEASTIALPTTTVTTARLDVGFIWTGTKWRIIAQA